MQPQLLHDKTLRLRFLHLRRGIAKLGRYEQLHACSFCSFGDEVDLWGSRVKFTARFAEGGEENFDFEREENANERRGGGVVHGDDCGAFGDEGREYGVAASLTVVNMIESRVRYLNNLEG